MTFLELTKQLFRLCLLVAAFVPRHTAANGVQTHFGDISFAGGMAWEPLQDLLYLTGQVGKNGCWVAILQRQTMKFLSKSVLPEPAVCQTVLVPTQSDKTALVLATTEEGGLFTNTRANGSSRSTQYGLVIPVQWQDAQASSAKLPKGLLLHEDPVQYPRSIIQDPQRRDSVFVASLHSASSALTEDFRQASDATPNLTPSGLAKYGNQYFLHVKRVKYNLVGENLLDINWRKPFGLGPSDVLESYSVSLANMIWNQGALLIVGSTRGGGGLIFGEAQPQAGNVTKYTHAYCMNGFLSKLDPTTGQPWKASKGIQRYSRGSDKDTYIEAVCSAGDDATEIFITGHYVTLSGSSSKSVAFLAKLDARTMATIWHEDFVFSQNAFGIACGVGTDGVFMAGIVESGGTYGGQTSSLGLDDLFVVKSELVDGHADWVRQIGTQGNDRLAHGGNGLLVVHGGVVLFGDTTGDLQATNHKGTEIFVVELDESGTVSWSTTETSGNENDGGSVQIQVPKRTDDVAQSDGDDNGRPITPQDESKTERAPIMEQSGTGGGIGMILAAVALALILIVGYVARSRKQEQLTERALVFSYLHAFDLEDVEVRHSATGGWHGTYVGNLAKGKGLGTDESGAGGRLSHSSIVKDSLFVDYETAIASSSSYDEDSNIEDDNNNDNDNDNDNTDDDDYIRSNNSIRNQHKGEGENLDFEDIGRLEEQFSEPNDDEYGGTKPWGRDII